MHHIHPLPGTLALFLTLGVAPPLLAQTVDTDTPGTDNAVSGNDCALLKNGVQRLACYDKVFDAGSAQQNASEEKLEQVRDRVDPLVPDTTTEQQANEEASASTPESDAGVMSSVLDQYVAAEKAIFSFSGSFVSHRPTYILPFTWISEPNRMPTSPRLGESGYDYRLDNKEAKYQISFKVPLLTGLLDDRTTLWFGYTQQSFWQVYNRDESAPFRETNYEPEVFLRYQTDYDIGPGRLNGVTIGFNHQSNGQSEPRSRSWNRVVATAAYSYDRWLFMVQPWYRIPEGTKDDNSDIQEYLGYANYHIVYKLSEDRTLSLKLLNNLRSDNRTSVEFGYSFPIGDTVKGFFQYYNGYGESLIDYNERVERFGIGIMLNNWF
ncbi:MAG TPA: phospholipase A [Marinobacter sp.]|uniref:phospholipase A n=1 Tax=Marinobacter sp. TaxID=50741 RepID=UPI002D7EEF36|nr:phospholipase A [Marinobacter sp.]HET8800970.1 phospholipase A [Marinobacter sp.]